MRKFVVIDNYVSEENEIKEQVKLVCLVEYHSSPLFSYEYHRNRTFDAK